MRRIAGYCIITVAILLTSVTLDFAKPAPGGDEQQLVAGQEAPAGYRSPGTRHKV